MTGHTNTPTIPFLILFLSLSVLLPPVHRFIQLLRLTFPPLRSTSSSIGILDFDPAPCMTLLWVTVWAFCVAGVVGLFLCTQGVPDIVPGKVKRTLNLLLLLLLMLIVSLFL